MKSCRIKLIWVASEALVQWSSLGLKEGACLGARLRVAGAEPRSPPKPLHPDPKKKKILTSDQQKTKTLTEKKKFQLKKQN